MKYTKLFVFWTLIFSLFFTTGCHGDNQKVETIANKRPDNVYLYATSNALKLGESKLKSKVILHDNNTKMQTLEFFANVYKIFDIIGIQEVSTSYFGSQAVGKIVQNLNNKGGSWDSLISNPTVGPGTEKFAVIFRSDKFVGLHPPHSGLVQELASDIDREPYHAILKEKKTGKLIHIYLFHLQPYKKSEGKDPENEVRLIGEKASAFEKNNVIMSGDYNLPHEKLADVFEGTLGLKHWINQKTSLKNKEVKGSYLAKEYDNIFTSSEIIVSKTGVLDFVPLFGDLKESKKISDHLVPWIEFKIK